MQLNKNTWHYRVWDWTHSGPTPDRTNLCSYVQRIIWLPLLYAVMMLLFYTIVPAIFYLIATPIGLLLGWRPTRLSLNPLNIKDDVGPRRGSEPDAMVPYTLFTIRGFEMKTYYPVIIGAIGFLEYLSFHFNGTKSTLVTEGIIVAVVVAIISIITFCVSDTMDLIKAWLAAKKQGVCPIVTFKEEKVQIENQSE